MDERVYSVLVCSACFTQLEVPAHTMGDALPCSECGSEDATTIRFRCARSSVLKQADPHRSLVERTVYFGCVRQAGHYYFERSRDGYPVRPRHNRAESLGDEMKRMSPWGMKIDGGLFPRHSQPGVGKASTFHLDGWTALAFEDNSVDSRPQSWSIYCIPATLDGPEALAIAREAFPTIFARYAEPGLRDTPPFEVTVAVG